MALHGNFVGAGATVAVVLCVINAIAVVVLLGRIWLRDLPFPRRGGS
jgi:hypothetical protein